MNAIATRSPNATTPQRLLNVVRLHVANPFPTLVAPWLITFVIFGLNLAVWNIVAQAAGGVENLDPDAFQYNGGILWIVVFMMVVGVQAMSLTFPFALGFAVTRRDFFWGSALYFVLLTVLYSTGLTALAWLERATDGWGIGGAFFQPFGALEESLNVVWFLFFAAMLVFFFVGAAVSAVWVRWRANGLYVFFIALAALIVGGLWVVGQLDAWAQIGEFFSTTSATAIAAWTLPVTAVSAIVGYLLLRRATSKG